MERVRSCERDLGLRDGEQDLVEEIVGGDAVGERLVREHEPVAHHVEREIADVLGQRVGPPAEERQRRAPRGSG